MRFVFDNDRGFIQYYFGNGIQIGGLPFGTYSQLQMGQGNTIFVDVSLGDDSLGSRNTLLAFKTITAACSASQVGDVIYIMPGVYHESFVIPDGIHVVGASTLSTIIRRDAVSSSLDLITMGINSRLESLSLQLFSDQHVPLKGIVFSNGSVLSSRVSNVDLNVNNSTAPADGTSNVYGVFIDGTGYASHGLDAIHASTIQVNSAGSGSKRAVISTSASRFGMRDSIWIATSTSGSGHDAIALETTHPGAELLARYGTCSGSYADISQTSGSIVLGNTYLVNNNANSKGFETVDKPNSFFFADTSGLPPSAVRYMRLGTQPVDSSEIKVRIGHPSIFKSMFIRAQIAPGVGTSAVFTVRKNGIDTILTGSLIDDELSKLVEGKSVPFNKGDDLSIKVETIGNTSIQDVLLTIEEY